MATCEGKKNARMEWTTRHDILLLREVLVVEPYKFKKCSNERGKLWTQVSNNLNKIVEVHFRVKQRGVRERFEGIQGRYLEKVRAEVKASGIAPKESEVDQLMEEITERIKLADASRESNDILKINKAENEQLLAEDIRQQAMETFGATRKRLVEDESSGGKEKRRRRSATSAVDYLREKASSEMKLKEEELATQKERLQQETNKQLQHQEQEAQRQLQQQNMLDAMREQQTQVQNMTFMMMQQQQQQNAAMMAILDKLINQK